MNPLTDLVVLTRAREWEKAEARCRRQDRKDLFGGFRLALRVSGVAWLAVVALIWWMYR